MEDENGLQCNGVIRYLVEMREEARFSVAAGPDTTERKDDYSIKNVMSVFLSFDSGNTMSSLRNRAQIDLV